MRSQIQNEKYVLILKSAKSSHDFRPLGTTRTKVYLFLFLNDISIFLNVGTFCKKKRHVET